jgi:hypothetical protein
MNNKIKELEKHLNDALELEFLCLKGFSEKKKQFEKDTNDFEETRLGVHRLIFSIRVKLIEAKTAAAK